MRRLLRLYPRAWRARYGAELASIFEARPPTIGDRFDIVRGAFDAHLHPELVDPDAESRDIPGRASGSVLSGLLIGLGSALWLVGVFAVAVQPLGFGDRDTSMLGLFVPIAGVLYAAGIARLVWSGGIPGRIGSAIIAGFAITILPMTWPLTVFGFYGLLFSLGITALNRAVAGRWPGWLAAMISVAAVLGLGTNTETGAIWLATMPAFAMAILAVLSGFRRLPAGPDRTLALDGARP
jgi:hypothetical protein